MGHREQGRIAAGEAIPTLYRACANIPDWFAFPMPHFYYLCKAKARCIIWSRTVPPPACSRSPTARRAVTRRWRKKSFTAGISPKQHSIRFSVLMVAPNPKRRDVLRHAIRKSRAQAMAVCGRQDLRAREAAYTNRSISLVTATNQSRF